MIERAPRRTGLVALVVLLVASPWLSAQGPDSTAPSSGARSIKSYRSTVKDIIEASLQSGQAYECLRDLIAAAPKRLSGSPGAAAAVAWAKKRMESYGFDAVRLEPVMVPHWERGEVADLAVVAPAGAPSVSLPIAALGGSVGTPVAGLTAEVVEVGSIGQLRNLGEAARGKIVFFNRPMDRKLLQTFQAYGGAVRQRSRGALEAAKVGAVAAVVRSMTTLLDDAPHTGAMAPYQDGVPRVPAVAVSTLGAERLSKLLKERGDVKLRLRLDARWHEDKPSFNVVGELRGREKPEEILVVGGHLDAWDLAEGAHDDGAGCMQSLEVVRLLRSLDLRPRRTIRVVLFMNEENGLRGGRTYHETHADEMPRHVMALESDRGGFTPRGFTTNANSEALKVLREIADLLVNAGADKVYATGSGGADISPMRSDGVVLVGFLPDCHRYFDVHHSKYDTFESVNEREIELGAACMAAMLYVVADLPDALPRNQVPGQSR